MKTTLEAKKGLALFKGMVIGSLALAVCLTGLPLAAQNAADQPAQPESAGTPPQMNGQPGSDQSPQNAPVALQPAPPEKLTLSAGTTISVRTTGWLSSDKNQPGDRFSATLDQPLVANGWVVARRGQILTGSVTIAQKSGHGSAVSQLGVGLNEMTLVDGQVLPVETEMVQNSKRRASSSAGRDAAIVGTTAGIGAVIGAAVGGGQGAAIGAGVGAATGAGVLYTRGNPTVIYPETLLTFRVKDPLTISTGQSQVAFLPVGQGDYDRDSAGTQDTYSNRPPRIAAGPYYHPYYAPYPYPYWGWGYYPGVAYFGFGFGRLYGPRFRGGFRR